MSHVGSARSNADWLWHLALASVVIFVWCFFSGTHLVSAPEISGGGARSVGYALGASAAAGIIPAVVVWAVSYFGFLRRSDPDRGTAHLIALYAVAVAINLAIVFTVQQYRRAEVAQAHVAVEEIRSTMKTVVGHSKGDDAKIDPQARAQGGAGALVRVFKSIGARTLADVDAYRNDVKATGYPEFLKPSRLGTPGGLKRARAGLGSARAVVARYRALSETRLDEARAAFEHCGASEAACKAAVAGFDQSRGEAEIFNRRVWDLETRIVAEMDAMVVDLEKSRGRWAVKGEKLVFSNRSDLDVHQAHFATVHRLVAEEAAMKRTYLQKNDQQFDQMQAELEDGGPAN